MAAKLISFGSFFQTAAFFWSFGPREKIDEEIKAKNKSMTFTDHVSVENITWKYKNAENNVLENISLDIKKGQTVAFVGKLGAGKTTLADVILGLLKPQNDIEELPDGLDTEIGDC
mgnify:CR=1 FL=1